MRKPSVALMARRLAVPLLYPTIILAGMAIWLTMLYLSTHQQETKQASNAAHIDKGANRTFSTASYGTNFNAAFGSPEDASADWSNSYAGHDPGNGLPYRMQTDQSGVLAVPAFNGGANVTANQAIGQAVLQSAAAYPPSGLQYSPANPISMQPNFQQGFQQGIQPNMGQAGGAGGAVHLPPRVVVVTR
jgi:hypothetical protein